MSRTSRARSRPRADRWWTLVAPGYDRAVGLVGWHRRQDALLSDVTTGTVLDVGCGPAHLAGALLDRGVTYVGVDRNAAMLERAQRRLAPSGSRGRGFIVRADITALPFRSQSFDLVVATGVLGLLDRDARHDALREMARVARRSIRLLEPVHRPGEPVRATRSRVIALVRDRPVELDELSAVGLHGEVRGRPVLARSYSRVYAAKHRAT